jgi:moderate conductance mechanosensitive channel
MSPLVPSGEAFNTVALLVHLGLIVLGTLLLLRFTTLLIRRVENTIRSESRTPATAREKRARTLGAVLRGFSKTIILVIGGLMAARAAGLDITPALAAAGGFGVAAGLGAQSLVRDWVAGFFIIHENQFDVGDVIRVAGVSGTVEILSLRHTQLRDGEGFIHFIPNGEIKVVTNLTKSWATPMVRVPVSVAEDPDRVIGIVEALLPVFQADPANRPLLLEGPRLLGIEDVGPGHYTLLLQAKTVPEQRLVVARALRRSLIQRLRAEGIAMAPGMDGPPLPAAVPTDPTLAASGPGAPAAASSSSSLFGESR